MQQILKIVKLEPATSLEKWLQSINIIADLID